VQTLSYLHDGGGVSNHGVIRLNVRGCRGGDDRVNHRVDANLF